MSLVVIVSDGQILLLDCGYEKHLEINTFLHKFSIESHSVNVGQMKITVSNVNVTQMRTTVLGVSVTQMTTAVSNIIVTQTSVYLERQI
jgi:hypothetical protein